MHVNHKQLVAFFIYTGSDFQLDPDRALATMSKRCFGITIKEDNDLESTEQFNISFTVISVQPEGVNINNFSEAIVYIEDDDGKTIVDIPSLCVILLSHKTLLI